MDMGDSGRFPLVLKFTLTDAMVEDVGQRYGYWRSKYVQQFGTKSIRSCGLVDI